LFTNVAAIAAKTVVIALVMLLFRSSTVLGLFSNTVPLSSFHRKKPSGVTSGDGGGQSHFEIISKDIPDVSRGSVRCVTRCPILLKVTECLKVDISVDGRVEETTNYVDT
jgi:hypothetical protein